MKTFIAIALLASATAQADDGWMTVSTSEKDGTIFQLQRASGSLGKNNSGQDVFTGHMRITNSAGGNMMLYTVGVVLDECRAHEGLIYIFPVGGNVRQPDTQQYMFGAGSNISNIAEFMCAAGIGALQPSRGKPAHPGSTDL